MIDTNTGHQRQVGIHQIDRIQAATQPHLQDHGIQRRLLKQPERCQSAHLEVSQGDFAAPRLYRSKGFAQLLVCGLDAIDLHPLVIAQQVRRTVDPHLQALGPQQGSDKSAGRALAIGTGDRDHPGRRLAQPHLGRYLLRARQPHIDGRGVQLLEVGEPFAQGTLGHRFAGAGGTTIGSTGAATNSGVGRPISWASRLPRRGRSS